MQDSKDIRGGLTGGIASEKPRQIQVADFDSVRQASMWRQHGSAEATRRLIAVLRTAILLGDVLTIDRNQLFDGIFFLSLGPQGIARELGLGSDAVLPLKVKCQPEPDQDADSCDADSDRRVPAMRGTNAGQGDLVNVDLQLRKVRDPAFLQASSARMATMADTAPNDWLCHAIGKNWVRGAGLTNYANELEDQRIEALICRAQDQWAQAIVDGLVAVDRWDRETGTATLDVPGTLRQTLAQQLGDEQPRPLAQFVLEQTSNFRKEVTGSVFAWMTANEGEAKPAPSARDRSTRALETDTTWHEARMAMDMWSRSYYRAIASQDGAMYLSFYDNSFDASNQNLAARYSLILPGRSRLQRVRDRAFSSGRAQTIRVEGEILDHMLVIAPPVFAQLYPLTRESARDLIQRGQRQAMFDMAYAAREAVSAPDTHSHRKFVTLMRVLSMSVLAVVISALSLMTDLTDMSTGAQIVAVAVSGILGVVAGLPWDDLAELFRLRGSAMTATLTMSNEGEH